MGRSARSARARRIAPSDPRGRPSRSPRAVGPEDPPPLGARGGRHAQGDPEAEGRARASRRRSRCSRSSSRAAVCCGSSPTWKAVDHDPPRRAVLDAAAGVGALDLREDPSGHGVRGSSAAPRAASARSAPSRDGGAGAGERSLRAAPAEPDVHGPSSSKDERPITLRDGPSCQRRRMAIPTPAQTGPGADDSLRGLPASSCSTIRQDNRSCQADRMPLAAEPPLPRGARGVVMGTVTSETAKQGTGLWLGGGVDGASAAARRHPQGVRLAAMGGGPGASTGRAFSATWSATSCSTRATGAPMLAAAGPATSGRRSSAPWTSGGPGRRRTGRPPFAKAEGDGRAVDHTFWLTPGHAVGAGLLVRRTSPQGLFRSDDGGVSWEPFATVNDDPQFRAWMGTVQDGTPDGPKLHSILVDPRDPAHLYFAMSSGGVHESRDRGRTWAPLVEGLEVVEGFDLADVTHHDPHCVRLCPSEPRSALPAEPLRHLPDRPAVETRGSGWGGTMPKRVGDIGFPMVVHPRDADTAWVLPMDGTTVWPRTSPEGRPSVYVTRNAGRTWKRLASGFPARQAWWTVKRQAMTADGRRPWASTSAPPAASCGRAATRAAGGPASRGTFPRSTPSKRPSRPEPPR